jgi:hypothetical protein
MLFSVSAPTLTGKHFAQYNCFSVHGIFAAVSLKGKPTSHSFNQSASGQFLNFQLSLLGQIAGPRPTSPQKTNIENIPAPNS